MLGQQSPGCFFAVTPTWISNGSKTHALNYFFIHIIMHIHPWDVIFIFPSLQNVRTETWWYTIYFRLISTRWHSLHFQLIMSWKLAREEHLSSCVKLLEVLRVCITEPCRLSHLRAVTLHLSHPSALVSPKTPTLLLSCSPPPPLCSSCVCLKIFSSRPVQIYHQHPNLVKPRFRAPPYKNINHLSAAQTAMFWNVRLFLPKPVCQNARARACAGASVPVLEETWKRRGSVSQFLEH